MLGVTPKYLLNSLDNSLDTAQKLKLNLEVLSDVGNNASRDLGLVFKFSTELESVYKAFGIDFSPIYGKDTYELPTPVTYIIGKGKEVKFTFLDVKNRTK